MLSTLKKFFAAAEGSIKGVLIPEELARAILTSLGSGTIVGLAIIMLQAILSHVASIFPNPAVASLASMILILVLDLLRRQNQGSDHALTVTPAPNPAPHPTSQPN